MADELKPSGVFDQHDPLGQKAASDLPVATSAPPRPTVRIFTSMIKDGNKQFFDVPLLPSPFPNITPFGWLMTNVLQHRGILLENAWIPERMIEFIAANPETGGLDPAKFDLSKVVAFKPPV